MEQFRSDQKKAKRVLLFQLLQCSQYIERETNNSLRQFGLKQQQYAVLNEVILHGPINQKELADNLLYGKSNISRIVKLLSEKRLIQVTVSTVDRRLTYLVETAEGRVLWKNCCNAFVRESDDYLSIVSDAEVKITLEQLGIIVKSLQNHRKQSL